MDSDQFKDLALNGQKHKELRIVTLLLRVVLWITSVDLLICDKGSDLENQ